MSSSQKRFRPKVAPDKRKRTAQACTHCRRLKRKCVQGSGQSCLNCQRSKTACDYEAIRKHEMTDENPEDQLSPQVCSNIEIAMQQLYPDLHLASDQIRALERLIRRYTESSEAGHSKRPSVVVETGGPSLDLAVSNQDFLVNVDNTMMQASGQLLDGKLSPDQLEVGEINASFDIETTSLTNDCISEFPTQDETIRLTTLFFQHHQSNWYYCDQRRFSSRLAALYNSGLQSPLVTPAFVCFALAAIAMGCQFEDLHRLPLVADINDCCTTPSKELPGIKYLRASQRLLAVVIQHCSLDTVQGCLLIALYLVSTRSPNECYTYLSLSLRTAMASSLHRMRRDVQSNSRLDEESKRVFWSVYCLERRASIALGQPEMLPERMISTPIPKYKVDLDNGDTIVVDRLNAFIELTKIQNRVLISRVSNTDLLSLCDSQASLAAWHRNLPAHCLSCDAQSLRATVHLEIMYLDGDWTQEHDSQVVKSQLELSNLCSGAAVKVLNLIETLKSHNQIALFSHMDFHSCSSAVILLLLDTILHPQQSHLPKIQNAIATMDYISTGNGLAKTGTKLVKRFHAMVDSILSPGRNSSEHETKQYSPLAQNLGSALTSFPAEHEPLAGASAVDWQFDRTQTSNEDNEALCDADGFDAFNTVFSTTFDEWLSDYSFQDLDFFGFNGFYPS